MALNSLLLQTPFLPFRFSDPLQLPLLAVADRISLFRYNFWYVNILFDQLKFDPNDLYYHHPLQVLLFDHG